MIRKMFKRMMIAAAVLTIAAASTAYAGTWQQDAGSWYYINEDGSKATGRISDNGKDYYLAEDGKMLTEGVHLLSNDQIVICNADGSIFYSNSFHREGMDDNMLLEAYKTAFNEWDTLNFGLKDLNNYRTAAGVPAFQELDFELSVVATYRCIDMVNNGYFSHYKGKTYLGNYTCNLFFGDGIDVWENILSSKCEAYQDISYKQFIAESNLFYTYSEGHYRNMLIKKNKAGLGIYRSTDGQVMINTQIYK